MSSRSMLIVALTVALIADAVLVSALIAGTGRRAVADAQTAQRQAEAQLAIANARIAQLERQLATIGVAPAPSASPSSSASPSPSPSSSGVETPPEGSATRTAILDAITARVHGSGQYVVDKLQVSDGWVYAIVEQTDPNDPNKTSEKIYAVCEQPMGGTWSCQEAVGAAEAATIAQQNAMSFEEWLMKRYPLAPSAIFQ